MTTPLEEAYEYLFGVVKRTYAEHKEYPQELVGIQFDSGKMSELHVLTIDPPMKPNIASVVEKMLVDFPLVVHLSEAWASPANRPEVRSSVILLAFYTEATITVAKCPILPGDEIERGKLELVLSQSGACLRDVPLRH